MHASAEVTMSRFRSVASTTCVDCRQLLSPLAMSNTDLVANATVLAAFVGLPLTNISVSSLC